MAALYTPQEVIEIAKLSQFFAAKARAKGALFSPELSPNLFKILYTERKSLEWAYNLDPTLDSLQNVANYVYRLCGRFGAAALGIIGEGISGGSVVTPITPSGVAFSFEYLIPITASDFATATEYNDSRIAGKQLEVFWKNVQNFETTYGWQINYTPTGFEVFVDDGNGNNAFDAFGANADAEFNIYIVNPTVSTSTATAPVIIPYVGVGGETFFTDSQLAGKTTVTVIRATPYPVIYTGTPSIAEALFTSATGRIDFNTGNPIGAGEYILVIAI